MTAASRIGGSIQVRIPLRSCCAGSVTGSPKSSSIDLPDRRNSFEMSILFSYVAVPEKYFVASLSLHDWSFGIRVGAPDPYATDQYELTSIDDAVSEYPGVVGIKLV